jgi:DNA invertase Pin-like site-specific DNA recombinase
MVEQVDTTTTTGKFAFHLLAAVAESERQIIADRVRAGLRYAVEVKKKKLGRPRKHVDVIQINSLRASGHSWRSIAGIMGLSVGTVYAAARSQEGTQRPDVLCA